jgi:nitroimidazol reductase NimA-like FMN-containing flavoprotein (pyridoxamine 5'-phosphate oxidase superfamily)
MLWSGKAEEEEAEAEEEKIRLKHYISLRSKGRPNKQESAKVTHV